MVFDTFSFVLYKIWIVTICKPCYVHQQTPFLHEDWLPTEVLRGEQVIWSRANSSTQALKANFMIPCCFFCFFLFKLSPAVCHSAEGDKVLSSVLYAAVLIFEGINEAVKQGHGFHAHSSRPLSSRSRFTGRDVCWYCCLLFLLGMLRCRKKHCDSSWMNWTTLTQRVGVSFNLSDLKAELHMKAI